MINFWKFWKKRNKKTEKRKIGDRGEKIAGDFLKKRGFKVLEYNYWKKFGEIDIIAGKKDTLHFVEVKSVTRENLESVSQETYYRPEENVHPRKLMRLNRAIQCYLDEKNVPEEMDWQIDVVTVVLDKSLKRSKVEIIENVILE